MSPHAWQAAWAALQVPRHSLLSLRPPQVPASALETDGDAVLQDLVGIREQASKADLAQTSVAGGSYE